MARQFTSVTCVLAETQRQAAEGDCFIVVCPVGLGELEAG